MLTSDHPFMTTPGTCASNELISYILVPWHYSCILPGTRKYFVWSLACAFPCLAVFVSFWVPCHDWLFLTVFRAFPYGERAGSCWMSMSGKVWESREWKFGEAETKPDVLRRKMEQAENKHQARDENARSGAHLRKHRHFSNFSKYIMGI